MTNRTKILFSFLLGIVAATVAYHISTHTPAPPVSHSVSQEQTPAFNGDIDPSAAPMTPTSVVVDSPVYDEDDSSIHVEPDNTKQGCSISPIPKDVSWKKMVHFSEPKQIFPTISTATRNAMRRINGNNQYFMEARYSLKFFDFGKIIAGPHEGERLVVSYFNYYTDVGESDGVSAGNRYQRYLLKDNVLTYLSKISQPPEYRPFYEEALKSLNLILETDENFTIPLFETPLEGIELKGVCVNFFQELPEENEKSGADAGKHPFYGDFYLADVYLHTKLPDGTVLSYYHLPPPEVNGSSFDCFMTPGKRESGGTAELVRYTSDKNKNELKELAPLSTGEKVYVPKSASNTALKEQHAEYKDDYEHYMTYNERFSSEHYATEKFLSYDEYVAQTPLIYWEDAFGRMVKCENTKLVVPSMAEPLIYFYPVTEQKISVSIDTKVKFSASEPQAINNAWNIIASPSGQIMSLPDRKKYPYIFWEGKYAPISAPKKGFVVKREDTASFLKIKLAALGLNEKESHGFMEYWLPKLMRHPYCLITFLDAATINDIAPLHISPAPDTVIRVMMDFAPLSSPIESTPIQLPPTPKRTGFTVVEWGGMLR